MRSVLKGIWQLAFRDSRREIPTPGIWTLDIRSPLLEEFGWFPFARSSDISSKLQGAGGLSPLVLPWCNGSVVRSRYVNGQGLAVATGRNGCAGRPSKILNASTIIPSCVFDGGVMCIGAWGCARCELRDECGQGVRQNVITSKDAPDSTQPRTRKYPLLDI